MSLSEAAIQTRIRIRGAELGIPLERNNVGACTDATGRTIRYGLANDSAQKNKRIKSGDLIGLLPLRFQVRDYVSVPPHLVGVMLSVECKREDWCGGYDKNPDPMLFRANFNDREEAQAKWIDHVRKYGGVAFFARSVAEFEDNIRKAGFVFP